MVCVSGTPDQNKEGHSNDHFAPQFDRAIIPLQEALALASTSIRARAEVNVFLTLLQDVEKMKRRYAMPSALWPFGALGTRRAPRQRRCRCPIRAC